MFKNNVLMASVDTKEWCKKAGVRAVKTFAQSMASMITVGATLTDIDWKYILSVSVVSAIYSIVTSVAGIPEVSAKGE